MNVINIEQKTNVIAIERKDNSINVVWAEIQEFYGNTVMILTVWSSHTVLASTLWHNCI
jgi:hypothetical protein